MVRYNATVFLSCLFILGSNLASAPAADAQQNQKIIWVAHYKTDCVGVGPQKCFLIKDNMYDPWKVWYNEIERLDWEEGFAYEVVVTEVPVENPPADAPSTKLRVVELLTMINAASQPTSALPLELQDLPPEGQAIGGTAVVEEVVAVEQVDVVEDVTVVQDDGTVEEVATVEEVSAAEEAGIVDDGSGVEEAIVEEVAVSDETASVEIVSSPNDPAPQAVVSAPPPAPAAPKPDRQPSIPAEELQFYRGHLTIGVGLETRTFKICGAESGVWIEDRSDDSLWRKYRDLSGYPNRPVFLVVQGDLGPSPRSGFGAHYDQQLTVFDVQEAATEGLNCSDEIGNVDFIAFGNEPFWQVKVSPEGIVYSEAGGADWSFPYREPMATETRRVYWGTSADGSNHRIQVSIEEKTCRDTMADAEYGFTATVQIDDRELSGCARVGSR